MRHFNQAWFLAYKIAWLIAAALIQCSGCKILFSGGDNDNDSKLLNLRLHVSARINVRIPFSNNFLEIDVMKIESIKILILAARGFGRLRLSKKEKNNNLASMKD